MSPDLTNIGSSNDFLPADSLLGASWFRLHLSESAPLERTVMNDDAHEPRVITLGEGMAETYGGGQIEWLANKHLTPGAEMTFGHVRLGPGGANMRHVHPNCHELLFVLEGCIEHDLGSSTLQLNKGDLLHIPIGVPHQARNHGSEDCVMVVTYSSEDRQTVPVDD